MPFVLIFLIGFFTGLRSLTPVAVVAWGVHIKRLLLPSALSWMGNIWVVGLFALGALGELVADKLPKAPSRTAPPGLIARILFGSLCGACLALAGGQSAAIGIALGLAGALAGCYGGYQVRSRLVKALGTPDFVVALVEDIIAIGGSIWVVSNF
jgi:uncharacterized membrane protein